MITPEPDRSIPSAGNARGVKSRGVSGWVGVHGLGVVLVLVSLVFGPRPWDADGARTPAASAPSGGSALVSPQFKAAEVAVVRIVATLQSCHRRMEGSGFVYAPERVLTTAHHVAGVSGSVTVTVSEGRSYTGVVVLFDPDRDVAVLRVPGLSVPPLRFQSTTQVGDDGVMVENAGRAGITTTPTRIISREVVHGGNIFWEKEVVRRIYRIQGKVVTGMPGGPLLALDGTVSGVVFAAALDEVDRGYALTAEEVASDALTGMTAVKAVSTSRCSK